MKNSIAFLKEKYYYLTDNLTTSTINIGADNLAILLDEYANQSKWISVEDSLPLSDIDCNCLLQSGKVVSSSFNESKLRFERYINGVNGDRCYNYHYDDVTHWQPFPTAL